MYIYISSTYTQTGTLAWGIHSNECDQWVHVSYFISRSSEIYIYVVTLYIFQYILYPTSIQRRDRRWKGVYFSTNKPRHEELTRRIQNVSHSTKKNPEKMISMYMYLQENHRITDIRYYKKGVHACHFTIHFWHLVNIRRFNLEIRQSRDKC